MTTAVTKLLKSRRGQTVLLPPSLRFEGDWVTARRVGNGVLLLPASAAWQVMREALDEFEPGFQLERQQPGVRPC